MHELMMNCLYLLVICLSVIGGTAVILITIGMVKGAVKAVKEILHDSEND